MIKIAKNLKEYSTVLINMHKDIFFFFYKHA